MTSYVVYNILNSMTAKMFKEVPDTEFIGFPDPDP
jgi:hypothetical protein